MGISACTDTKKNKISASTGLFEEVITSDTSNRAVQKLTYKKGALHSSAYYYDNVLHGIFELYYESGNVRERGNYSRGYRDGIFFYFNEEGKLNRMIDYVVRKELVEQLSIYSPWVYKNQEWIFNADGVIAGGRYLNIICSCQDTVQQFDTCKFDISVNNPILKDGTKIVFNAMSADMKSILNTDTIYSKGNRIRFDILINEKDSTLIEMEVSDIERTELQNGAIEERGMTSYVKYQFVVIGENSIE